MSVKRKKYLSLVQFAVLLISLMGVGSISHAASDRIHIAVAANFYATLKTISHSFTRQTGVKVNLSNGASGMLFNKIKQGAPYDLFFSADEARPKQLEAMRLIEPGSRFTYVRGQLVALALNPPFSPDLSQLNVHHPALRFVAIANPKTAPYGQAAVTVLRHYGLYETLKQKRQLALGESVGKAYQYALSGNAQIALVAKSYVVGNVNVSIELWQEIDAALYPSLRQQAVVLKGKNSPAVKSFLTYLQSSEVQALLKQSGYLPALEGMAHE